MLKIDPWTVEYETTMKNLLFTFKKQNTGTYVIKDHICPIPNDGNQF